MISEEDLSTLEKYAGCDLVIGTFTKENGFYILYHENRRLARFEAWAFVESRGWVGAASKELDDAIAVLAEKLRRIPEDAE